MASLSENYTMHDHQNFVTCKNVFWKLIFNVAVFQNFNLVTTNVSMIEKSASWFDKLIDKVKLID